MRARRRAGTPVKPAASGLRRVSRPRPRPRPRSSAGTSSTTSACIRVEPGGAHSSRSLPLGAPAGRRRRRARCGDRQPARQRGLARGRRRLGGRPGHRRPYRPELPARQRDPDRRADRARKLRRPPDSTLSGRAIGINAQIRSDSGGASGIGFAVPILMRRAARSATSRPAARSGHAYAGLPDGGPDAVARPPSRPDGPARRAGLLGHARGGRSAVAGLRGGVTPSRGVPGRSGDRSGGDVITAVERVAGPRTPTTSCGSSQTSCGRVQTAVLQRRALAGHARSVAVRLATGLSTLIYRRARKPKLGSEAGYMFGDRSRPWRRVRNRRV